MSKRVAITKLNARAIDIINAIRDNATAEYQSLVPRITRETEIPRVGDILYGYPAMANIFINSLINRIAAVSIKSATFNNAYKELKKGFLEYGETIEEIYVSIVKARVFSPEKAPQRELARTLPDVKTAFHTINWRVQYPVTISHNDLNQAFLSADGVNNLITKIIDSVYNAAEYDEYLLFKYLIIKAVTSGKMYPVSFDASDTKNAAKSFRAVSNQLTFLSDKYSAEKVTVSTPKERQYIFMDSTFNAGYDVDVLASAFNMDKADFSGRLMLIDDFTTFDNDRFSEIRAESNYVEEVTQTELDLMKHVKAVLVDSDWFQVYDELQVFSNTQVNSGMYWNYFLNIYKVVSFSPFSNAVVFVDDDSNIVLGDTIATTITDISKHDGGTIITITPDDVNSLAETNYKFVQTQSMTTNGIAVHRYGAFIIPTDITAFTPVIDINNTLYTASAVTVSEAFVGQKISFSK